MTATPFVPRLLDLGAVVAKKSCFLFGPRQTGKSSLVGHTIAPDVTVDLLESETYLALAREPQRLRQLVTRPGALVCVDEIQRLPGLLNEVHALIEQRRARFILTGSSARKLRRGGENLLGGRARSRTLHPFVSAELGSFSLATVFERGLLPSIWHSDAPAEDLAVYCGDYLTTEIAAEGLVRSIPSFSRFLEVAALSNGQMLNFTKVAADAQVARTTVHEYFEILRDTLVAFEVPAFRQTKRRRAIGASRFFFFDLGVVRTLQGRRHITPRTPEWGQYFEHLIAHELRSYLDYRHPTAALSYWRSASGFEVDFVVGDQLAIEVKASHTVGPHDFKGLRALADEGLVRASILVCDEPRTRRVDGIEVVPWRRFLERLWSDEWGRQL